MTTKIETLFNENNNIFTPLTHVKAVVDDNGNSVEVLLNSKVEKVKGKGLSSNDFTNEEKNKLAQLSEGGSGSSTYNITEDINLFGSVNSLSDGIISASPTGEIWKKAYATLQYIEIASVTKISIDYASSQCKLYILQWDKNFNYIGNVTNTSAISQDCRFFKIAVVYNGPQTEKRKSIGIHLNNYPYREISYVKNGREQIHADGKIYFGYEINDVAITDNTGAASYVGNTNRIFNQGSIILPPNYSRTGKAVPLVIHFHGTGGYSFKDVYGYNYEYLNFIALNGYAVVTCSTYSSKHINEGYGQDGNLSTTLSYECYTELYKFVTENFNVQEGAYVMSYSAGGRNMISFMQTQPFKIRCGAGLAPALDIFASFRFIDTRYVPADSVALAWHYYGVDHTGIPNFLSTKGMQKPVDADVQQRIFENLDKFAGQNPFVMNSSNLDYKAYLKAMFDNNISPENVNKIPAADEALKNAQIHMRCPLKIWHALDDVNVPYWYSEKYVNMARNANSMVYLRTIPRGYGGHYAVGYTGDTSKTPKTDYQTKYGGVVNIPIAYAELVDWFNRW